MALCRPPAGRADTTLDHAIDGYAMRRRPLGDDLTIAYVHYVAAWLGSWPTRRRLRRTRRDRYAAGVMLSERRREVDHIS